MSHLLRPCQPGGLLLALTLAAMGSAQAQTSPPPPSNGAPRWVGHFTVLAGNATVGGLTGGLLQKLRGGSFKDGFARGALGGVVLYAGKRVAAQSFWGAGLLGREINALGVSVVRNASDGRPTLSRLFVPLGPLPLRTVLDLSHGLRIQPQLDVAAAGWMLYGLYETRLTPDWAQSLSGGAMVFRADRRLILDQGNPLGGFTVSRSIFASDPLALAGAVTGAAAWHGVLAHERVHVLQQDFVLTAWSQPLAELALGRLPGGRAVSRYVAVDALDWVVGTVKVIVSGSVNYDRNFPTEMEAYFLTGK